MSMENISIVIPVYNTGNLLFECYDSVKMQVFKPHEIIIVDDGSETPTKTIISYLQSIDGRVKVVEFGENRGLSAARNAGLKAATSEIVLFLDSDDMLSNPRVLEYVADEYGKNKFDMLRLPTVFYSQNQLTGKISLSEDPIDTIIPNFLREVTLNSAPFLIHNRTCWQFAYRREFLTSNGIYFLEELRRREDVPFLLTALCQAKAIYTGAMTGTFYRQRANSIMSSPQLGDLEYITTAYQYCNNIIEKYECDDYVKNIVNIRYVASFEECISKIDFHEQDIVAASYLIDNFKSVSTIEFLEKLSTDQDRMIEGIKFAPGLQNKIENGIIVDFARKLLRVTPSTVSELCPLSGSGTSETSGIEIAKTGIHENNIQLPAVEHKERPKLFLHVGLTKTGSTSIQNFCEVNRASLRAEGLLYPFTGVYKEEGGDRGSGHNFLIRDIVDDDSVLLEKFKTEVQHAECPNVIISCENISYNPLWRSKASLEKISKAFSEFDVIPILVKRSKLDWAFSMYKEAAIGGWLRREDSFSHYLDAETAVGSLDFDNISELLATCLGSEVQEISLDRDGGDLIADFLSVVDIDRKKASEIFVLPNDVNIGAVDNNISAFVSINKLLNWLGYDRRFVNKIRSKYAFERNIADTNIEELKIRIENSTDEKVPEKLLKRIVETEPSKDLRLFNCLLDELVVHAGMKNLRSYRKAALLGNGSPIIKKNQNIEAVFSSNLGDVIRYCNNEVDRRSAGRNGRPNDYACLVDLYSMERRVVVHSKLPIWSYQILCMRPNGDGISACDWIEAEVSDTKDLIVDIPVYLFQLNAILKIRLKTSDGEPVRQVCAISVDGEPKLLEVSYLKEYDAEGDLIEG